MSSPDQPDPLRVRFADECAEHVAEMTRELLAAEPAGRAPDYPDILRRLHSIKGAAAAAGLPSAVRVAHRLETIVAECAAGKRAHTPAVDDILFAAFDELVAAQPSSDDAEDSGELSGDLDKVLSAHQLFMAERALASKWALWEIRLDADRATFADRVHRLEEAMVGSAQIISRTGASDLAPGADVTYLMLVALRETTDSPPIPDGALVVRQRRVTSLPADPPVAEIVLEPSLPVHAEVPAGDDLAHLRGIFLENASEKVHALADGLVRLEAQPQDLDLVNDLFRHAHSLKGSGATFGMPAVTAIAHSLEEVLDGLRSGRSRVSPDVISAMLEAVDAFNLALRAPDRITAGSPEVSAPIEHLRRTLTRGGAPVERATRPAPTDSDRRQGSVRVSLDKLDRAINRVGELTVNCAAAAERRRDLEALAAHLTRRRRSWDRAFTRSATGTGDPSADGRADVELVNSLHAILVDAEERLVSTIEHLVTLGVRTDLLLGGLHTDVMGIRMVPLRSVFSAVPRTVRDLARTQGKEVALTVTGEETEIDKRILEMLEDPLTHLVRNAVDHGLEPPDPRRRAGKPTAGRITLSAHQSGSHVVIEIADDGKGIDPAAVRAAAVRKNILTAEAAEQLDDQAALSLIFRPGFSLSDRVTEVSGRGVGLDVVMRHIQSLQGTIEVRSTPGTGTTFTLRLPLTLAISDVLFVRVGDRQVCFPMVGVISFMRVERERLTEADGRRLLEFDGRLIRSVWLDEALASASGHHGSDSPTLSTIIVSTTDGPVAFVVDEVLDQRRVVIKPIGALLGEPPGVAGATVTTSGDIAIVLDAPGLLRVFDETLSRPRQGTRPPPSLLVVDDSPTTQEMVRGILTAAGYRVDLAGSGEEAIRQLRRRRPAGIIADVQMPGMDGFELTRRVKAEPDWRGVPVIILSALDSDTDRRRGLDAGADAYAVKAGLDRDDFLRQVDMLIGVDRDRS